MKFPKIFGVWREYIIETINIKVNYAFCINICCKSLEIHLL